MTIRRPNLSVSGKVAQETHQAIKQVEQEFDHWFDNVYDSPALTTPTVSGALSGDASLHAHSGTAIPAGGTAGAGLKLSATTNFGVFFGSGAPTLSAAKGSLYMRSDGSGTNDRMYVNTNGSTTWTAVTTVA